MEDISELHPESLRIQCRKAVEVIDKENDAYKELINKLRTNIVENDLIAGETANSIKAYASDLIMVVEYAIKANELDKPDHQEILDSVDNVLADKVDINEVLRGEDIHDEINYINEQISVYEEYINQIEQHEDVLNKMIKSVYQEQIEDLESILQDCKYKEERYDTIEAETNGLFANTSEIRKLLTDMLNEMRSLVVDNEYKTIAYSDDKNRIELALDFPEVYIYLKELRDEKGNSLYTEEQILGFWKYFKQYNTDLFTKLEYLKKNHTEYYIEFLVNFDGLIEKYVTVPWYYNVMKLEGDEPEEICLKSYFDGKNIDWTQEKIDELWDSCREIYDKYKINLDPKIFLAIIIQEGNGSFNTSSTNLAADGQNGYEANYSVDLEKANELIFGKFIGYLCYGDKFEECINSNDVLKEQNEGGIFDYFNWNTPIVRLRDGVIYSGVYACHSAWGNNVENIYEDLTYEGAARDYSNYVISINDNKILELIGDMDIIDYSFEVVSEGQDSNGNNTLIVKGTKLDTYLYKWGSKE